MKYSALNLCKSSQAMMQFSRIIFLLKLISIYDINCLSVTNADYVTKVELFSIKISKSLNEVIVSSSYLNLVIRGRSTVIAPSAL